METDILEQKATTDLPIKSDQVVAASATSFPATESM